LLIFNPEATSVSVRVRDVIAHALAAEMSLEVVGTKRRNHATALAAGAAHEGVDLVISLGGDGTLNEVINGLAGTSVPVAPLPGGGTNVFARTLGLPNDPIEATSVVLERLADGSEPRSVGLGRVNGRAFGFCAGVGFDAAVVGAVERRFRVKQRVGQPYFIAQAVRTFFLGYEGRRAPMSIELQDRRIEGLGAIVVCESDPYTFLGQRPVRFCPQAGTASGLDITALHSLRLIPLLRLVRGALTRAHHVRMRDVEAIHDVAAFRIEAPEPVPYQVDGEFAGRERELHFSSMPDALRVIA